MEETRLCTFSSLPQTLSCSCTSSHLPLAWAQVMVFEKSAANLLTTHRGAGLGLDVNGQKALKAIKPGGALHTTARSYRTTQSGTEAT